jgi:ssDNA-binding Zn-finger/Zn-ribbon topoisomerase 1
MKPENVFCPECGGPMTSRANRRTGQRFWGCNKFPACKGTRNTDGDPPARRSGFELTDRDIESISAQTPSERMRNNDRRRWDD